MSLQSELAATHQLSRIKAADAATVRALRLWRQVDPQELDAGWALVASDLTRTVTQAQVAAAAQATAYLNDIDRFYGRDAPARLVPEAFGGVMLDGRELEPALFSAVTTTKAFTRGLGATRAFEVGASYLATIVGAAIHDMGRQADNTLGVGRKFTRYIRVVNPGACSRCAILAGKASYATAFRRHPRCRCTAFPIVNDSDKTPGFFDSPDAYFDSLTGAEQDRVFTKAGAEAIRRGADPLKVVNSRRGAYGVGFGNDSTRGVVVSRLRPLTIGVRADGSPLQVYATKEGTTRRGQFGRQNSAGSGRRTTTVRLMPEQIIKMAGDNPTRWAELLRRYGYLA